MNELERILEAHRADERRADAYGTVAGVVIYLLIAAVSAICHCL